ncbi:MAG: NAD-dependent protein deacylase [Defluviitaleaceae bacterium]|nr:NAD-dependent protein deacylase [Defluviitaleaceae bacterium]
MHLDKLRDFVSQSSYIVFFGGAGVSTESGIPDFRSTDGLYNEEWEYPPEVMISSSFFSSQPKDFYDFYRAKLLHLDAEPNNAHRALAVLEKTGKLRAVITQNIDGLHQKAGSKAVIELHGSVWRNFCQDCNSHYEVNTIANAPDVPICNCGGIIKPDIVLYEDFLDEENMIAAMDHIAQADMLIIGGTSLGVYPAAGLLHAYRGERLVLINKTETHMDDVANLIIRDNIGDALSCFI